MVDILGALCILFIVVESTGTNLQLIIAGIGDCGIECDGKVARTFIVNLARVFIVRVEVREHHVGKEIGSDGGIVGEAHREVFNLLHLTAVCRSDDDGGKRINSNGLRECDVSVYLPSGNSLDLILGRSIGLGFCIVGKGDIVVGAEEYVTLARFTHQLVSGKRHDVAVKSSLCPSLRIAIGQPLHVHITTVDGHIDRCGCLLDASCHMCATKHKLFCRQPVRQHDSVLCERSHSHEQHGNHESQFFHKLSFLF